MRTDLFDFVLPADRIALEPVSPRDSARLLVVRPRPGTSTLPSHGRARAEDAAGVALGNLPELRPPPDDGGTGGLHTDLTVSDLPSLLEPGDALVFNDTRVIPAALTGRRKRGEASAEIDVLLTKRLDASRWLAFARPAKRLRPGDVVRFGEEGRVCLAGVLDATVVGKGEGGEVEFAFSLSATYLDQAIAELGSMPLPPYIAGRRASDARDRVSYQTIYAAREGAVAAPTAGLHFTPELMVALAARGVSRHFVTLHVGPGTFLPVKAADTAQHQMHAEWGEMTPQTAAALNATRAMGKRIVAVGSTSLRVLESAADADGVLHPFKDETSIFITPGYRFRAADALMTNFHLPRSTLFMLVAAFCGLDVMQAAYAHAIAKGYRFYSYGDASLLFRGDGKGG